MTEWIINIFYSHTRTLLTLLGSGWMKGLSKLFNIAYINITMHTVEYLKYSKCIQYVHIFSKENAYYIYWSRFKRMENRILVKITVGNGSFLRTPSPVSSAAFSVNHYRAVFNVPRNAGDRDKFFYLNVTYFIFLLLYSYNINFWELKHITVRWIYFIWKFMSSSVSRSTQSHTFLH